MQDAAAAIAGNLKFGSPALFALAVLGLFGRAWRPRFALDQLHLLALLSLSVVATYFIASTTSRFYLVVLVLFSIWACAALRGLRVWAQRSASLCGLSSRQQGISAALVPWLAMAAVIAPAAAWAMMGSSSMRGTRAVKAAAKTMAGSRAPLRIADASTPFAFHARADFVWLPYTDEATALRFLNKKQVTHVVVRSYTSYALESVPYLKKWLADGIPGARLIAQVVSGSGEKVLIYELRPAGGG